MRRNRLRRSTVKDRRILVFVSIGAIMLLLLVVSGGMLAAWRLGWNGMSRLTVVWEKLPPESGVAHSIGMISIDPSDGNAVYLRIPGSVLLDVPYGYKTYPASSVYRLGELDPKRGGGILLAKSVEATLGVAVDGYVISGDPQFPSPAETEENLLEVKQTYFTVLGLIRHLLPYAYGSRPVVTDIDPGTWYRIWRLLRNMRSDQIRFLDIEQSLVLEDRVFPDGTVGKAVDIDRFDTYIGGHLQDMRIRSQDVSIEVVNATGQERLASKFGTVLERLGGHVIAKTTAKTLQTAGCLYYTGDQQINGSYIISYLQRRRGCVSGTADEFTPIHSDVMIVLGEEFVR